MNLKLGTCKVSKSTILGCKVTFPTWCTILIDPSSKYISVGLVKMVGWSIKFKLVHIWFDAPVSIIQVPGYNKLRVFSAYLRMVPANSPKWARFM